MMVKVNSDVCQGLGLCIGLAPDVFDVDDTGLAIVKLAHVDGDLLASAADAELICPTGAIQIEPADAPANPADEPR